MVLHLACYSMLQKWSHAVKCPKPSQSWGDKKVTLRRGTKSYHVVCKGIKKGLDTSNVKCFCRHKSFFACPWTAWWWLALGLVTVGYNLLASGLKTEMLWYVLTVTGHGFQRLKTGQIWRLKNGQLCCEYLHILKRSIQYMHVYKNFINKTNIFWNRKVIVAFCKVE